MNDFDSLCRQKIEGIILDTWAEIGARFGISGNAAKKRFYRKKHNGFKLDKDDNILHKLEREKIKLREEKKEISKYQRAYARTELICEYVTEGIKSLIPLPYSVPNIIINTEEELLLNLSDLHYGALIYPEEINHVNEYNSDIFQERLWKLRDEVISIAKRHNVTKLYIFSLGDILENDRIFVMQKVMVDQFAVQQLMSCAEILSTFFRDLAMHFSNIEISIAPGNHGRLSEQRNMEHMSNNFEFILYWFVRERLWEIPNIHIDLSFDFFLEKQIFDFWLLGVHGEYTRNQTQSLLSFSSMFNKPYSYLVTGHWHNSKQVDSDGIKEVIQCGSFCGPSLFTVERLQKATAASQTVVTFRKYYGKYASYKILL